MCSCASKGHDGAPFATVLLVFVTVCRSHLTPSSGSDTTGAIQIEEIVETQSPILTA
jgi:hypothetical protein